MRWFRLWAELIDDPKQHNLDDKSFRIFILLLCLAAELERDGEINLSEKDVSWRLRISQNILTRTYKKLVDLSVITNDNGNIQFLNWEKRQFRSDCSTERVKRFRNVARNRIETAPETETETDKNNELLRSSPRSDRTPDPSRPHLRVKPNGNGWLGILESDLESWAKAYPAVDIQIELQKAIEWVKANPLKTKKNWYRFLTGWFSRCQERGGSSPTGKAPSNKPQIEYPERPRVDLYDD